MKQTSSSPDKEPVTFPCIRLGDLSKEPYLFFGEDWGYRISADGSKIICELKSSTPAPIGTTMTFIQD